MEQDERVQEVTEVFARTYLKSMSERIGEPNETQQAYLVFCYEWLTTHGGVMFETNQWGKLVPIKAKVRQTLLEMEEDWKSQGRI